MLQILLFCFTVQSVKNITVLVHGTLLQMLLFWLTLHCYKYCYSDSRYSVTNITDLVHGTDCYKYYCPGSRY